MVASAAIGAGADEEDEDLIEEEDATESDQQAEGQLAAACCSHLQACAYGGLCAVEEEYWEDEDYSDEGARWLHQVLVLLCGCKS